MIKTKKVIFGLATLLLASSLVFTSCSGSKDNTKKPDTPATTDTPAPDNGSGNNESGNNNSGNNESGNNNSGNNNSGTNPNTDPEPTPTGETRDGVKVEYLLGAGEGEVTGIFSFQDWGNGTVVTGTTDRTLTPGTNWGSSMANFAHGDIVAGYIARFDNIVIVTDESAWTSSETKVLLAGAGEGSDNPTTIDDYATEEDGLTTYVVPVEELTNGIATPDLATQIALQFFGTGSIVLKKVYFEANETPKLWSAPLMNKVEEAETLMEGAVAGEEPGNYGVLEYNILQALLDQIDDAKDDPEVTQADVYDGYWALVDAMDDFLASKVPDFPFAALSGVAIPDGATVIFKASDAANKLFDDADPQVWWVPDGGSFTIKYDEFDENNTIIEAVTVGNNACGALTLNVDVPAGKKLVVSCYTVANTSIKPVAPDAVTNITGANNWQLVEVPYASDATLTQFGIVATTAEENSIFIDAVYLVDAE